MSLSDSKTPSDYEKQISLHSGEKDAFNAEVDSAHDSDSDFAVLSTERDIATHIISVRDDPTLNPWTIRAFVIGLGLSAFGGVLGKSKFLLFFFLSGVETLAFEQRRYTTSNQYGLVFFFLLPTHLIKLSTANCIGVNAVPGHYFIYSWHNFGDSNTAKGILPYP